MLLYGAMQYLGKSSINCFDFEGTTWIMHSLLDGLNLILLRINTYVTFFGNINHHDYLDTILIT